MTTKYDEISDYEIRIIGAENASPSPVVSSDGGPKGNDQESSKHNKWKWMLLGLIVILIIVLSIIFTLFYAGNKRIVVEEVVDTVQVNSEKTETVDVKPDIKASLTVKSDTINDIELMFFFPEGYKAELKVGGIDTLDENIMMCVQAADIRSDNGEIVSAYVLRGEPLSRGVAKKGFCAIVDGVITLGMAEETPLYERVVEAKGDFFRQYPLVHDSEMQENKPKGKAVRNALCILDGKVCIVRSTDRESFHDFAQALKDYGVTEAIALTGADATFFAREDNGVSHSYGVYNAPYKNVNYIVFKTPQ